MITFYIDDSGSVSLNDSNQPIFLFSSVCIPGLLYNQIKLDMETVVNSILNDIKNRLLDICSRENRSKKLAEFFFEKIVSKEFEIHCSEIIRGDGVYMLFDSNVREKYLMDILNLVNKYDLDVLTVYCDKIDYKNNFKNKPENEIEDKKDLDVSKKLLRVIEVHLNNKSEQGNIVIDEGNKIINKVLIPNLESGEIKLEYENISRYIQQVKSHENVLVQLADVIAYVSNMNLSIAKKIELGINVSDKNKSRSERFYTLIKNNNILENINLNNLDEKVS